MILLELTESEAKSLFELVDLACEAWWLDYKKHEFNLDNIEERLEKLIQGLEESRT